MPSFTCPAIATTQPGSSSKPGPTDLEAVNEVVRGNREMFEVIVRRYNAQLYRAGMAYLRDHARTEDAMQNAYLKAFRNLHRFRGNAAFGTWLTRIIINECLMMLRREKRFTMETIDGGEAHGNDEPLAAPASEPLHQQEMKAVLEQAIQALPRRHRAVYLLREVQQLSTAETARCLGLSTDNVKVSLHRAREGLKAQVLKTAAGVELFAYPARYCDPLTTRVMRLVLNAPPLSTT
jgi:RNA polymerase sigma-70 factor (ECF subfamily)